MAREALLFQSPLALLDQSWAFTMQAKRDAKSAHFPDELGGDPPWTAQVPPGKNVRSQSPQYVTKKVRNMTSCKVVVAG